MHSTFLKYLARPVVQLFALALASLAIYSLVLVRPYSLWQWWDHPGITIAKIAHFDPAIGAAYVISILALFLLYWLACRLALRSHTPRMWVVVLVGALAFNLVMLALNPIDSGDIFDYVIRARMTAYYGANPFYTYPRDIQGLQAEPFYAYSGWHDVTTAYGPLWELLAAGVSRLAGNGVIANVLAFKLVAVLAYAATVLLVALALRRYAPERALYGVTFLAWNPLVIYSFAGNGHNDAVMMFFAVLGLYFMVRRQFTLGALAETAGALVKFIPVLIFPVILVAALKYLNSWPARFRYLVVTGVSCAALVAGAYWPFWRGGDILGQQWRSHLFTTSVPALFKVTLQQQWDAAYTDMVVGRAAALVLGVWVLIQLYRLWRTRHTRRAFDWALYMRACVAILVFYLLVTTPWFQPWYGVWVIAIGALLPDALLSRGTIVIALSAMFKMPINDFLMQVRPDNISTILVREWQGTFGTLMLPWIYFLYNGLRSLIQPEYRHGWQPTRGLARSRPDETPIA